MNVYTERAGEHIGNGLKAIAKSIEESKGCMHKWKDPEVLDEIGLAKILVQRCVKCNTIQCIAG